MVSLNEVHSGGRGRPSPQTEHHAPPSRETEHQERDVRHDGVRMAVGNLEAARGAVAEFCRRNGIRRPAQFGSVLTGGFPASSDVDVLVEFEPGRRVGYLRMVALARELSSVFGGRSVDLRTPSELSRYFRDEVLRTAAVQYAAQ